MKLFSILIFALGLTQCASMKMDQNPPFVIKSATYTHITGGLPGNNSLNLMIQFTSNESMNFNKVYFQNRVVNAVVEQKGDKKYIAARYNTSTQKSKYDLSLHEETDDSKEGASKTKEKFPFNLKENEAIISYEIKNKTHYYKLTDIKKIKSVFMH